MEKVCFRSAGKLLWNFNVALPFVYCESSVFCVATYPVWRTEFCFLKGVRFFSRLTFSLTRPPVTHFLYFS